MNLSSKCLLTALVVLAACGNQHDSDIRLQHLGDYQREISSSDSEAKEYFNQGLVLTYGFQYKNAVKAFDKSIEEDPACAICYFGKALALGPHWSGQMTVEDFAAGKEAIGQALVLQAKDEKERGLIEALGLFYQGEPDGDREEQKKLYSNALGQLHEKYPEDPDIATLFALSLMTHSPYWNKKGEPLGSTAKAMALFESVLDDYPTHVGSNHLYIHLMESSKTPDRALVSADLFNHGLAKDVSHLVHMPSHIYVRVGRYHDATLVNEKAIAVANRLFAEGKSVESQDDPHNWYFLWYSSSAEGRKSLARKSAEETMKRVQVDAIATHPSYEVYFPVHIIFLVQFQIWDEILKEPRPPHQLLYSTAIWHFARGMAFVKNGNLDEATQESREIEKIALDPRLKELSTPSWPAADLVQIAELILQGEIAFSEGDEAKVKMNFQQAIEIEDRLPYSEPPYRFLPARVIYGRHLLCLGKPEIAEPLFLQDLERYPLNGPALYGLMQSYKMEGNIPTAQEVERYFNEAWRRAEVTLDEGCPDIIKEHEGESKK